MHTGTDANRSFHLTGTNGAVPTNTAFVNNEWDWIDGLPANVNKGYTWTTSVSYTHLDVYKRQAQAWDPAQAVAYWGKDLGAYALGSNSRVRAGKARRELGWAPGHGDVIAWVRQAIA